MTSSGAAPDPARVLNEAAAAFLAVLDRHTLADLLAERDDASRGSGPQPGERISPPRLRVVNS